MYSNYQNDLKKSLLENSSEYRLGYEEGVNDLAERLKKYYLSFTGDSFTYLISHHIEMVRKDLLKEEENND